MLDNFREIFLITAVCDPVHSVTNTLKVYHNNNKNNSDNHKVKDNNNNHDDKYVNHVHLFIYAA